MRRCAEFARYRFAYNIAKCMSFAILNIQHSIFVFSARSSLRILPLHDRVQKRSDDGDRRPEDAQRRNGVPECDDRRDDDHHALDRVPDGMRNRLHAPERHECDLIEK